MAKAKFVYRGKDRMVESVVRKSKQSGSSYDSYVNSEIPFYKAKEGECTVRVLPPTWEDTDKWGDGWDIGVYLHYSVGPDNAAYLCLDKMKGEECPVCRARNETNDDDEKDALRPSYRSLCWVIDRDNEKAGPQVWSIPITLFRDINARSVDKKTNTPILIDDPEEGFDVLFSRSGSGLKTKYEAVEVSREPSTLADDERLEDRWLNYVQDNPLPDILVYHDAEHIEKVLFGRADARDRDAEPEEEAPRRSRRSRSSSEETEEAPSRRRSLREELDDEIPFESPRSRRGAAAAEEEEPEQEEEAPRRGRRSSPREEPEEEARPTRRRLAREEPEEEPEKPAEEVEEESPTGRARRSLGRLKNRR